MSNTDTTDRFALWVEGHRAAYIYPLRDALEARHPDWAIEVDFADQLGGNCFGMWAECPATVAADVAMIGGNGGSLPDTDDPDRYTADTWCEAGWSAYNDAMTVDVHAELDVDRLDGTVEAWADAMADALAAGVVAGLAAA